MGGRLHDEGVGEGLVGGHAGVRVDGQAAFDEVAGGQGDAAPVFERGEGVIGDEDGLHFFEVGVPVEGGVAAEEEVGYHAYGPDVAFLLRNTVSDGLLEEGCFSFFSFLFSRKNKGFG